ncbi:MAG TPA: ABC transporter ATP-binding protein [Methanocorpusculum sp.]|nr:ABC transporter ATP-binding protein [Methanocorpusculum sp.]HJK01988.1 ABC transporter ATP-binding protein [Methanocorpusculum sp.]
MNLEVSSLYFSYAKNSRIILDNISFSIDKGDLLAILGPNGVGKSTMFRCILGFLRNYQGSIFLNGKDIHTLDHKEIARDIAYIPQSTYPVFNYTVLDVVLMGLTNRVNLTACPSQNHIDEAYSAMKNLGIAHLRDVGYGEISGGERQLSLIARAIVQKAKILIMDEPTANLDYGNQFRVMAKISDLARRGYSIILSTHNPDHAFLYANRTLVINEGRVIVDGAPEDVLDAQLIKKVYGVNVHIEDYQNGSRHYKFCIPIDDGTEEYR